MDSFSILGHKIQRELLNVHIKSGKISHFYLFIGPPGIGKTLTAIEFALSINCLRDDEICKKKVLDNIHPSVKIIDEEKSIKISQIKEIEEEVNLSLLEGRKKVIILKDTEKLTPEAANSLLKTLEEPPPDTVFILISSYSHLLLKTIVSRAQVIRFSILPYEVVNTIWHEKLKKEDPLPVYDGTMQFVDNMSLRDSLFNVFLNIFNDPNRRYIVDVLEYGSKNYAKLKDVKPFIVDIWSSFLSDIYLSHIRGIINLYRKEEIIDLRRKVERINLPYIFDLISLLEKGIIYNINFNIWWEYLIVSTYDILFGG